MKKGMTVLLAILMTIGALSALSESLFVDNRETDKIFPERLNLRDQPSKNGAIIGMYYTGAEVSNLGEANESFNQVEIGGKTGYMMREYLITAQEAEARYGQDSGFGQCRAAQVDLTGMVQTEIPLLKETDFGSKNDGYVQHGERAELIGILDDWAYIAVTMEGEKKQGYVPLDTLTDVDERKVSIVAGSQADTQTILYDAPNDKAKEIMILKNGTACFSLFGRREGEWRRVRVGGVAGWIRYTQTDNLKELANQPRSVIPYYPLLMQLKGDAKLYDILDGNKKEITELARAEQVELLAECGDYAYVRTLEGEIGAYDCGVFGYIPLSNLKLAQGTGSVGVAQVDEGDLPALILDAPEETTGLLGALCAGAQVRIADYTNTDYMKISLDGVYGYVRKDSVRIITRENTHLSQYIPQRALTKEAIVLRDQPSAKGKKLQEVSAGVRVYMLGTMGKWAYVQASERVGLDPMKDGNDQTGFVELAKLNAPASTTHLTAFVHTDKVNLRGKPGNDGEIIGRARSKERLRVAEYGVDWSLVETPAGKRGYILTSYLEFE